MVIDLLALAFIFVAAFELLAVALIFAFRNMMHSALALALVFFANSLAFLVLGQPQLAIIQLLVLVGGVATYISVSVASSSYSKFKHVRIPALAVVAALLFAVMVFPLLRLGLGNITIVGVGPDISMLSYMYGPVQYLYLIFALLVGTVLGSILLLKRIGARK